MYIFTCDMDWYNFDYKHTKIKRKFEIYLQQNVNKEEISCKLL